MRARRDPSSTAISHALRAPTLLFRCVLVALAMTFLWGVWSSLLLSPTYVGCWCASLTVILAALYVLMRVGAARRELLEARQERVASMSRVYSRRVVCPLRQLAGTVTDEKLCIAYKNAVDREVLYIRTPHFSIAGADARVLARVRQLSDSTADDIEAQRAKPSGGGGAIGPDDVSVATGPSADSIQARA